MLYQKLHTFLLRFKRGEKGSVALETVILVPMLFWAFMTTFAIFHAYREHALSQKAAYTIGDMISRDTNELNQAYLVGAQKVFQFLTLSKLENTALRVSFVKFDEPSGKFEKDWSRAIGMNKSELSDSDVAALTDRLPVVTDQEGITIVETWIDYNPPFDTGLASHEIKNFIFTRPRYSPQLCWEQC